MKKIFIDAGHNFSGFNTGAVGNGMREQDVTFEVARYLGEELRARGLVTKLSRPTLETNLGHDNAGAVNARWQMSNAWGADYFISIHVNAGGGTGAETLYFREDALGLARTMQDVYSTEMGLRNRRMWYRDNVAVIRQTRCPSILLELAFIDSPPHNPDVDILRNRRRDMARACAKGFFEYLGMEKEEEEQMNAEKRFNTPEEMPAWAVPTIRKLMDRGILRGDEHGMLRLTEDMVRILVMHDRAGIYDTVSTG